MRVFCGDSVGYLFCVTHKCIRFAEATRHTFCSSLEMHVFCGGSVGYICCLAINARLVWSNAGYLSVAGHACMSFAEAAWETLFVARSACMCFAEVTLDTFL